MNCRFPSLCIEDCVSSAAVLIAWLRARARVDHRDLPSLVEQRHMGVPETHEIMGERRKACQPRAAGINIFVVRFPRTGVDEQNLRPSKFQIARHWSSGQKG